MSHVVDWSQQTVEVKGSDFLRFFPNQSYTVRLLTRPLQYHQRWSPVPCRVDPERDPFAGQGEKAKPRCSAFVLDLADGTIKIMDIPVSVRQPIAAWSAATGKDPCSSADTAFRISVKGQGLQTRYSVVAVPMAASSLDGVTLPPRAELEARLLAARRLSTEEEIQERMART